jgi:hypothetical protein
MNNTGLFFRNFDAESAGQNPIERHPMLQKLLGPAQVALDVQFEIESKRDIASAKPD